jgi:hypothetical protein
LTDLQGGEADDGFRKTMTEAICWYDHLIRLVNEKVEAAIWAAEANAHTKETSTEKLVTRPIHH